MWPLHEKAGVRLMLKPLSPDDMLHAYDESSLSAYLFCKWSPELPSGYRVTCEYGIPLELQINGRRPIPERKSHSCIPGLLLSRKCCCLRDHHEGQESVCQRHIHLLLTDFHEMILESLLVLFLVGMVSSGGDAPVLFRHILIQVRGFSHRFGSSNMVYGWRRRRAWRLWIPDGLYWSFGCGMVQVPPWTRIVAGCLLSPITCSRGYALCVHTQTSSMSTLMTLATTSGSMNSSWNTW